MITRSPKWYGIKEIQRTLQKIWHDLRQQC